MGNSVRAAVLVNISKLRAGIIGASNGAALEERLDRLCDALVAWGMLPGAGREFYSAAVLDCLFDLVADIEDDPQLSEIERKVVELSLWDAAIEVCLTDVDASRGQFIQRRRHRLQQLLELEAKQGVETLLYKWAALLRLRTEKIRQLPGPFRDDISAVVAELLNAGLPRRAKALAMKFQLPVDPLVRWTIEHRPESEEVGRTKGLLQRVESPPRPVPYRVFVCARALHQVLSAPLTAIPMAVGASGCITVGGRVYGATIRS